MKDEQVKKAVDDLLNEQSDYEEPLEPQENDIVWHYKGGFYQNGKMIIDEKNGPYEDIVYRVIKTGNEFTNEWAALHDHMDADQYWPGIWVLSDHGNYHLMTEGEKKQGKTKLRESARYNLDDFTQAYIDAALWSSTDDDGTPLDELYTIHDIAEEAIIDMKEDCKQFQASNAELLAQVGDVKQNGYDFWFTRNGYGVGFWDRGYGEVGKKLSDAAKSWGFSGLYIGDDGLIYVS